MSSKRRFCVVVGAITALITVSFWQLVHAEGKRQLALRKEIIMEMEQPAPSPFTSAITFPKDSRAQGAMRSAQDLINDGNWGEACKALQFLLGRPEDGFIQVVRENPGQKGTTLTVSIRAEANRLLGTMPKEGLEVYETLYGGEAKNRLDEAKSKGDPALLGEVALQYLHTKAGGQAAELLGTRSLERDEPLLASLYFERLLSRPGSDELGTRVLLKATLAFTRSGDKLLADDTWKRLKEKSRRDGGVIINGGVVSLDKVREELDKVSRFEPSSVFDWVAFRGSASRNAQGVGGSPFMDPAWAISTLPAKGDQKVWTEKFIEATEKELGTDRGQALLPAFFPIAVKGKVIYRTYDRIYVADLKRDGAVEWWTPQLDGGVDGLLGEPNKKQLVEQWANSYRQFGPKSVLFDNSIIGTLSTDSTRVFAIDDLIIPPHPQFMNQFQRGGWGGMAPNFGAMAELVQRNTLKAFNLETGKLVWELGGKLDNTELKDSFFLGSPLPLAGKLYVLNEKEGELRLICLECKDTIENPRPPDIVWKQPLANTKDRVQLDFNRRIHAAQLAYGDGILICPTNAGAVLGVDLLSHSLVWAHSYRDGPPTEPKPNEEMMQIRKGRPFVPQPVPGNGLASSTNEWKVSAPAVHEGRVVFTAPDGNSIHCLNLKDGRLAWKANRGQDDLYFAGVFASQAMIVSKNSVRFLNMLDGKETRRLDNTGMPSGQGTASENVYYLPIKASAETKEPEVLAIDVNRGVILAHTRSRKKNEVPGNLIFSGGLVISQNLYELKGYPQLKVKLDEADKLLAKNPQDPKGLTERGELRLDKGELQGAISDLHGAMKSLGNNPPAELAPLVPKVKLKLYESLTQLMQDDFVGAEKYIDEYRELCKSDNAEEQQKREGNFLCLLGKGREGQGRLSDAFQAYMEFATVAGNKELVSVIDQPNTKCRPDVWSRGRIAAMMAKATADQRKPLDDKITERWNAVKDTENLDQLRQFVALFGSAFHVGKQAKMRLADKLLEENKEEGLREAQLLLLQLREQRTSEPELAARAVDALARLNIQKGLLDHATHYYQELGRNFADVVVRDGKTGNDLSRELTTDKRFLPYLEGPRHSWNGKFRAAEIPGNSQPAQQFTLEPVGDVLPYFQRNRLVLDANNSALRILDQATGEERFRSGNLPAMHYLFNQGHQNLKVTYQVQGNIVILNLGHMVYAFDPIDKKKLWEYNLFMPGQNAAPPQVMRDRDGFLMLVYPDGFQQKLGQTGPVEASYVCLQTREGLVALDPAKGSVLWSKSGISSRTHMFGDEKHIYLVDMNNEGNVSSAARAVRTADGVVVNVKDFAEAYQNRVRVLGRNLLVKEEGGKGELVLRLYDVHDAKDLWKKTYPAGSVMLKPEDDLAGAIEPDGSISVVDLTTRQEVLKATLNYKEMLAQRGMDIAKVLEKVTDAHLLCDRDLFYVMLNKPAENMVNGGIWQNVFMMRCINVNGMVYAFQRETSAKPGKLQWAEMVPNQMLVMEQFKELPLLLFTSRYNKWVQNGNQRWPQNVQATRTMHKRSGKLVFDKEIMNNGNQFHSVQVDFKKGTIDLVNFQFRISHKLEVAAVKPQDSSAGR